ncbi:hypothetical protein V2W30_04190 [Streptomyces sp. Q6]|uniref:Uncharacterized protein n=1 Tax=Streptomyces citrinus TaxID=3118173 RepID=A0ACD5A6F4_9ACTN
MIESIDVNLRVLLEQWHGAPTLPAGPALPEHAWLPPALAEWYALASQWQDHLITLKEILPPEQIQSEGGVCIFMQDFGDQAWAFDIAEPTVVLEGQSDGSWVKSSEGFEEFLVHNAVHDAAYSAPHRRSSTSVPNSLIPDVVSPLQRVNFGGWHWPRPGHQIFLGKDLIADIGPAMEDEAPWGNRDGYSEVQVGALSAGRLDYLDSIDEISWTRSPLG